MDRDSHTLSGRTIQGHAVRRLGRAAIIISAFVLATLAWIGARDAIHAHRDEAQARVQAEILAAALAFEEQLRRELLSLDQTLRILEYEWERDRNHFNLAARYSQVVVLRNVSLQLFVADAHGSVRESTRREIIGTDVSGRDYFRYEAELPADDGKMFVSQLTRGQVTHLWQINLVRRLENPDGSFAGVIAASYDTNAFLQFYRELSIKNRALIGVVSMISGDTWSFDGSVQSPVVSNIRNTPIFAAMHNSAEGSWAGASGLDVTDRIYAFAAVPDRDLTAVVGTDRREAMAASASWERNVTLFACGITVLIILMALLLLREMLAARRRHEALMHERAILEATLTGMSDGIMMVDADLRLLAWNQHFPEFTGVPANILRVGLPMEDMLRGQVASGEFGPVDLEAEVGRRLALLRAGAAMGTIERSRPSGRQLEIRRNPLPGGGFVTLYTDVTARRAVEERLRQAQTLAAIGRLTAGVAHDFNNLLAAISGNAEIMHGQLHEHPTHGPRLAVILQTTARGTELIRRLLAFARKEALAPELVDLNAVVRGMADLLRATLGRRIRVETQLAAELWPTLVDPSQIEHVILNLAINARDAMPDGGTLTIATSNTTLSADDRNADLPIGDCVAMAVSDTGTGMSEEVIRNAFEPFFTTKPPGQGSGLGLSQVYGLASQSGGGVRIDSTVGKGTTVTILLPRAVGEAHMADAPVQQPGQSLLPQHEKHAWHRTILVVDDEPEFRETISTALSVNGFTVVAAESGEEALQLIDSGLDFHLLLSDFVMSGMNGVELAREVRARRPAMPVVLFTGGEGEAIRGERWVLMKPFLTRTLVEMLRAALGLTQTRSNRHSNSTAV